MGLTACFRKSTTLDKNDLEEIRSVANSFKTEDGLTEKEAVTKAINLKIQEELDDYAGLFREITKKGGVIPSPEELKAIYLPEKQESKLDQVADSIDAEIESLGQELADLLKKQSGTLNAGVDPQILAVGAKLGALYVAKGAVSFAQYARSIMAHMKRLGVDPDLIKPALKELYGASQMVVSDELFNQMDDAKTVRQFDLDSIGPILESDGIAGTTTEGGKNGKINSDMAGAGNAGSHGESTGLGTKQQSDQPDNSDMEGVKPGNVQGTEIGGAAGENGRTGIDTERADGSAVNQSGLSVNGRSGAGGEGIPDAGTGGKTGAGDTGARQGTDGTGQTDKLSPAREDSLQAVSHFHISKPETLLGGGQASRFDKNKAAIELYFELKTAGTKATDAQKKILAAYSGWGSFGQELFQGSWDYKRPKTGWEERDKWLRDHLGESEWKSAQRSITNSHYTDPPTVSAMWNMVKRMGFTGGKVLEPGMGIGNFYGLMPKNMKANSLLSGIEMDELTGGMAQMIYPDANISIKPYQNSKTPDNFYDLVIGNWPFENTAIADRRYQKINPMLHDYYFLKAIDQTRPGGIIIGITSKGTMDKVNPSVRIAMAKKAELVASFRLPTGAFQEYAGTKVVTDIIILKKRESPLGIVTDNWIESLEHDTPSGTPVKINNYYHVNPKNVIGTIDFGSGTTSPRPGLVVRRPENMEQELKRVSAMVPKGIYSKSDTSKNIRYITNHTDDREGSLTLKDGSLFVVQGEHLAPANEFKKYQVADSNKVPTAVREAQLKALIDLRSKYAQLIQNERGQADDIETEASRKTLNSAYKKFVKDYGLINESFGIGYLKSINDPFYYTLSALESNNGTSKKPDWKPATILSRSTSRGAINIKNPSIEDAFVLARNVSISPDLEEIAAIAGKSEEEVRRELINKGAIFELVGGSIEPSDIYLSGNVRQKLRDAKQAVSEGNTNLERNVKALLKVIPRDIPYHEIEARMGASWVTPEIYADYIAHMLNMGSTKGVEVTYIAGRWKVTLPDGSNRTPEAVTGFGTSYVLFSKLINAAISNQSITIRTKPDRDGVTHVDEAGTKEVAEKISKIRNEFSEWVWKDVERRIALETEYNEVRNAWATPTFDGSFLRFEGMALQFGDGPFNLREHQVNAIWQAVINRKSLNAHEVGTGKTFTMGGIAIESRRYGIAKKPLILAHNANSGAVAAEIQSMYPGAKILYIDNLNPATIQSKLRQIANDDWDAIVMPHSLIDRMSLTEETLMGIAQEEIVALEQEAREAADDDGASFTDDMLNDEKELAKLRSQTAKDLVKARNKIIENIKKHAQRASKENAVSFEELGIDMIMVDESHVFKKPPIVTKMRMKGLNTDVSSQSISLQFLTRYVRANNAGGNIHLFTGTPITNTITEIYHQMRYIMEENMADVGVDYWDGWFGSFASELDDVELNAAAEYENVTRLASFINVPELRKLAGQYMDVVFSDDMPEMKPRVTKSGKNLSHPELTESERAELENGRTERAQDRPYKKVIIDTADLTPPQMEEFSRLQEYARNWRSMDGKTKRLTMLEGGPESPIITGIKAERASFDMRLLRGEELAGMEGKVPDHPDSKASRVINNILEVYHSDKRATQAVFMGIGISKSGTRSVGPVGQKRTQTYPTFSVAHDIIERLVKQGIPRDEIALVSAGTSKKRRKEIAAAVNKSKIRVVIGSTNSLGTGVNMQKNLRAMHHLDAPWMPGDLEQRNGRGHRQGNQWNTVREYRYITDRLDGRRWQVLSIKQRFIKEFLNASNDSRIIDGDAASEEQSDLLETFAEAAGDPRVLIRAKLQKKIERLNSRERMHAYAQKDAIDMSNALKASISRSSDELAKASIVAEEITRVLNANKGDGFTAVINGKKITKRNKADDEIAKIIDSKAAVGMMPLPIGSIMGLDAFISFPKLSETAVITVKINNGEFYQPISGRLPNIQSFTAAMRGHEEAPAKIKEQVEKNKSSLERMISVSKEPFKQMNELIGAKKDLKDLELDMSLNPVPPPSWLRSGAPIDTEVFAGNQKEQKPEDMENVPGYGWMIPVRQADKDAELVPGYGWMASVTKPEKGKTQKYLVTGHRWTKDGYFVIAKDADEVKQIPYMDAKDAQGFNIYTEHEFIAPEVVAYAAPENGDGATTSATQPATPTVASVAAGLMNPSLARQAATQQSGINPKTAIDSTVTFLDSLKLQEKIEPHVYATPEKFVEAMRIKGKKVDLKEAKRARGYMQGNALYLIASNIRSVLEVVPLLRHEILAHYGLNIMAPADKASVLKKIIASRYIPFIKQHWDEVAKTYGEKYGKDQLNEIAEETFARIAELDPDTPPTIWEQIIDLVMKGLRKIGILGFARDRFMNTMTRTETRALLKAIAAGIAEGNPNSSEIRAMVAWHGSPYDHDGFNSANIGTGEGGAAYGYGHYFSSKREVANWYKNGLSKGKHGEVTYKGKTLDQPGDINNDYEYVAALIGLDGRSAAKEQLKKQDQRLLSIFDEIKDSDITVKSSGKLYQVDLKPAEDEYLLWDKPIGEQNISNKTLTTLADLFPIIRIIGFDSITGGTLVNKLEWFFSEPTKKGNKIIESIGLNPFLEDNAQKIASMYMKSLGIRGIKYLDGQSRTNKEGNYNYVIFDDADIEITGKYALNSKEQAEYDQAVAKGLPMDKASRLQRARDMGFDTDTRYNHEYTGDPITEISEDGRFGGVFTLPNENAGYYDKTQSFFLKGAPAYDDDIADIIDDLKSGELEDIIGRNVSYSFEDYGNVDDWREWVSTFENLNPLIIEEDLYAGLQKARAEIARKGGFPAVSQPDEFENTIQLLDSKRVRSINAAFDPSQTESADLMASLRPEEPESDIDAFRRRAGLGPKQSFAGRIKQQVNNVFDVIGKNRQRHLDSQRQGNLDKFHGINVAVKRNVANGNIGTISADNDPYITARLSSGIASVMKAILLHGQPTWADNMQHLVKKDGTKGLLEIFEPVAGNINDFMGWMIANRAERLMREGKENNFTAEQIRAGKALGTPENIETFRQVAREFAAFKRSILDVAENAGLIDPVGRRVWDNADWIPFYREMNEDGKDNVLGPTGAGKGLAGKSSGIRQLRGGESAINDPLENIIMNFHTLLDASLKNNAVIKAIDFAPDSIDKADYKFQQELIPQGEVKRKLLDGGMPEDLVEMMPQEIFQGLSKMWAMKAPTDANVIRVMRNGRPQFYTVHDPLLLRAVTSFQSVNFFGLGAARTFKRVLTSAVTATPAFMLRNFIRDTFSTAIVSRDMTAATGALKGVVKAYRENGGAEHMLFAGASFASGYIDGTDTEATARAVRRSLRKQGMDASSVDSFMGSILDGATSMWDKYRHISEAIENANREAVFEATLKKTGSITGAAYEAKDLMDFSLRGDWPVYQVMTDVIPFFNARVQGLYRLGRTDKKQLALRGALLLMLPSLFLAFGHLDDDDYESLPDWDKDTYWHFWMGGEHFRIPKPFEVGVIFATLPERMFNAMAGKDDLKKFGQRTAWNIAEQLNLAEMPQIIKPAVEVAINWDAFGSRNIETEYERKSKSPRLRYNSRTSTTTREIVGAMGPVADFINLSPKKLQHLIEGYLGTFGAWGLAVTDVGARMLADDPARPTLRIDDVPVLNVLYRGDRGTPYYSTQYIQDIFDASREYTQILGNYQALMLEGKETEAIKELSKNRDKLTVLAPMAEAAKGVRGLNKRIDRVVMDEKKTPVEKRELIDEILSDRNELARKGVEAARKVKSGQ